MYYTADVIKVTDYYPFGWGMPGRRYNQGDYRYGFNGMEKDDEVKGSGNSFDFGARIYDSRLGRWLSIDPLAAKYPFISAYVFVADNPIIFIDPDGKKVEWADKESKRAYRQLKGHIKKRGVHGMMI